jgi:hypothetical protein
MLIADRELARKNGQSSAAIRATELLGKELGMFVDRSDNRHRVERRFSELPEAEQEAVAADLLARAREVIDRAKVIEGEAKGSRTSSRTRRRSLSVMAHPLSANGCAAVQFNGLTERIVVPVYLSLLIMPNHSIYVTPNDC